MEIIPTEIPDVLILKPSVFKDDRGYFLESYSREKLSNAGIDVDFVQDNESKSSKGVLRGLHFQRSPYAQGKLVRVIKGAVFDVAVDLRQHSPWFGKWVGVNLSEHEKNMCWIPPGFAHGFLTLEDETIFAYKCTNVYHPASEGSVRWNDPHLNIHWPVSQPSLSDKDQKAPLLSELKEFIF
ncbi:MAG: dTDP-4-dehydrorhamnose 3,5-epimerase [Lentimicrobium sp.]|jgi:dTDP-4-dehydrorhamnose 3,5-epimerase|nr:dTDP-4-dehydrorhamnose 3,5-epimerase [Lentimicrobium sp.]